LTIPIFFTNLASKNMAGESAANFNLVPRVCG